MSSNQHGRLKVGTLLECIKSESLFYKEGNLYKVVEADFGGNKVKGLKAEDNFFDPFSLILSSFKVADTNKQAIQHLKEVKQ